jgi:hypothetical protein
MANRTKRTDKSTGKYDTYDELVAAVMTLHKSRKHSLRTIGEKVGATKSVVASVLHNNEVKETDVDLNAMFNELWKVTG